MKLVGIVGWSGSGKTTLIEALLPVLIGRGFTVSTMKHTHHRVDLDQPGKDTFRHRQAGATDVVMVSECRWTIMHEVRDSEPPTPERIAARLTPVDIVLVEGFKSLGHDKVEVYRAGVGKPPLYPSDAHIVAVASDAPLPALTRRQLDLNAVGSVADYIVSHWQLGGR
ncbi:MAG: molybdopterin-guanine dinucleotide biosynthesis protein B [Rhodospirillales bacterium]|jgi:molybdopterin-guanine dinucleotide biosynthesis protein B|nr:molybdopterin-guanine dinucleotide biosynthesis protein B [Rhodospirillales bacterium]